MTTNAAGLRVGDEIQSAVKGQVYDHDTKLVRIYQDFPQARRTIKDFCSMKVWVRDRRKPAMKDFFELTKGDKVLSPCQQ